MNGPLQLICIPGAEDFPYDKKITVCSLGTLFTYLDRALR